MKKILISILLLFIALAFFYWKGISHESDVYVAPSPVEEKPLVPILFVGDIMMGRYVETLGHKNGESFMFSQVKDFLVQHITIANLEGPIPENHVSTPINGFSFSFASSTPRILKENGIAAVSLANNHMFDKGRSGYEETKRALDLGLLSHFGGYSPTTDDYFETKLGTTTVIVYGITMIATGWDEAQALEVTEKLRQEHPQAHLVVFMHWGDEYVIQNRYQKDFAHKLIDRGVDTIIGAHPHVVQGIEVYKEKPIFYSLGNFIFDQYWRKDVEDGYMVKLSHATSSIGYEIIPIHSVRSVPYIATSTKRDQILSTIASQSDNSLQSAIKEGFFYIQ